LLNSDIKVLGGCIDGVADFLDQNADVGVAGPKILNRDMTHQSSCRRYPTLWNNFCQVSGLAKFFGGSKFFSGEHMFFFKGDRVTDVNVLVGCFSALRRDAFEQVGLLDEGYYMYGDDLDWCRRFKQAGWRVVFYPGAQAIHYMGTSTTKKDPVRYAVMQQQSVLRYWDKYHGLAGRLSISALIFSTLVLRWTASLLKCGVKPAQRQQSRVKMRVFGACLRDLCSGGSETGRRT
jgi:GT2 family glycosyltransferase